MALSWLSVLCLWHLWIFNCSIVGSILYLLCRIVNHINPKHLQSILWASWCLALNKRCYLRPTFESFCQESIFKLVTFLLTSAISAISRSNVSQFGLKAQMHFQIVDVSFYWQGYPKGFFPVKLDLLFSPSPFLQCDWWSSQWGRGESRGSQKGWGMIFDIDAPCISNK